MSFNSCLCGRNIAGEVFFGGGEDEMDGDSFTDNLFLPVAVLKHKSPPRKNGQQFCGGICLLGCGVIRRYLWA